MEGALSPEDSQMLGKMKELWRRVVGMAAQLWGCTRCQCTTHLKMVRGGEVGVRAVNGNGKK